MSFDRIQHLIGWVWFTSLRRRLAVLALLAALLVAAIAAHRPVLDAVRGWRASRLAEEAGSHAAAGNWEEAHRAARASLQLQGSIDALRLYTEGAQRTRDPHSLRLATALFVHPDATNVDRIRVLRAFLDANDLLSVARLIGELEKDDYDPPMRLELVRFLVKGGQFREAFAMAELEARQGRGACDLVLVRALVAIGARDARPEVTRRLKRLLEGPNRNESLETLRLLSSLPDDWIHPSLAESVVERFGDDSALSPADQLRVALFRIGLSPDAREELIDAGIEANRERDLVALNGWLLRLGEAKQVAALTEGRRDLSPLLYEQRTSALYALGRFDDLAAELETPPASLRKVTILAVRAMVAAKRGEPSEAVICWNDAFALAKRTRDRNEFYTLAAIAERAGDQPRYFEALAGALEHPLGTPPPLHQVRNLLQWLYEQGEAERVIAISYRLLQREPGNPVLLNMHHYLRLLTGDPAADVLTVLEQLVSAFPKELSFRSTYALALLQKGQPGEALAQLDAHERKPADLPDAERAVYAATLHALERHDEAQSLASGMRWDQLPGFEAKVLRNLLAIPPE